MHAAVRVPNEQIRAYRLHARHLAGRLPCGSLAQAAAACGIQDSPPGSALLALHARVAEVTREELDRAVGEAKTLLLVWCMRGAPFIVPSGEAAVFTTGALLVGEGPRRRFMVGVEQVLGPLRMSLGEAVERTEAELPAVLAGRRLAIGELGAELARRVAVGLPPGQRQVWLSQGPYAAGQPVGEGVVHFTLRILSLEGHVCFAARSGSRTPFVLAGEWLGRLPRLDGAAARVELARRYLHCYGPSTAAHLAWWVGAGSVDAGQWWDRIADEVTAVDVEGRAAWMPTRDVDDLLAAASVRGVRLLPPRDPYVQARDRRTLIADTSLHRLVWRSAGEPGTVLADGRLVGTWRPRKSGPRLTVRVMAFERLTPGQRDQVEAEAASIAPLRGASAAAVSFGCAIGG